MDTRASVAAGRRRNRPLHLALALIVAAALVLGHLAAARGLLRSDPGSYSWTELLIDYQGGFAKRGLLGEVAFQLRHVVAPRRLIVDAVAGAYILAVLGQTLVLRLPDAYPGLLFLLSPAGGLFPLLDPESYGRKDAFVLLALVAGMAAASRARRLTVAVAAPMAIFAAAGLAVEIAWFYYPLVLAAALALRPGEPPHRRRAAAGAGALYTAACLGLTLLAPHVDTGAIARSWGDPPYPTDDAGALCCLNFRLRDAVGVALATLPNLGGYALGLAAGLLPMLLLLARRPPRPADAPAADLSTKGTALVGIVFATAPVFVAADWGRYIALWLTATFLWAWVVTRPRAAGPTRDAGIEGLLIRGALLLCYAGTWQLAGYQTPDRSALLPGALFQALRSAAPEMP